MVVKKTTRRTSVKRSVSKKQYKVVMTVKVGPFATKNQAVSAADQVAAKGINVKGIIKTTKGYMFSTKVGYKCASAAVQKQVVAKLRAYAKQSNLSAAAYKITT